MRLTNASFAEGREGEMVTKKHIKETRDGRRRICKHCGLAIEPVLFLKMAFWYHFGSGKIGCRPETNAEPK